MSIGATIWLWVSAAAIIPVIIHLWSRKSGRPKMLPTFRFLPDKSTARASRIQLHEIPLLFVRILLVLLIALLLDGLFFDDNPRSYQSVVLTETDADRRQMTEQENVLEIDLPSKEIDSMGWFRLLEQAAYDYQPGLIVAGGKLTANRFEGRILRLQPDVEWNADELADEEISSFWRGSGTDTFSGVIQRSSSGNSAEFIIEPGNQDKNAGDIPLLQLTINQNASWSVKAGVRQVADIWSVDLIEAELPGRIVLRAQYGEDVRDLRLDYGELMHREILDPGPLTGVQVPVEVSDSIKTILAQRRLNDAVAGKLFRVESNGDIALLAEPKPAFNEWIYAGAAHQLMRSAVGIGDVDGPAISDDQRQPLRADAIMRAGWTDKISATPILLLLMLIVWAAERLLSNLRGM